MSNSINTNVSAQIALQTLNATNQSLADTQNRISTGLKVNDAKDDSAVWSIAQTMRSQNAALDSVTASLNRGKSTLDVANTAGTAVSDLLTQMQSAVLAASDGSLDAASRASYQQKYNSLAQQIGTYIKNASFNGVNMLDGSTPSFSALANADGSNTITAQGQNLTLATGSSGGAAATPSITGAGGGIASNSVVAGSYVGTLSQASSFTVTAGAVNFTVNLGAGGYNAADLTNAINSAYSAAGGAGTLLTSPPTGNKLTYNATNFTISGGSGDTGTTAQVESLLGFTGATETASATAEPGTPSGVTGAGIRSASSFQLTSDTGTTFTVNLGSGYYSTNTLAQAINNAYSAAGLQGTAATVGANGRLSFTGVQATTPTNGTGDLSSAASIKNLLGTTTSTAVQSYVAATQFTETGGGGVITISGNETFSATTNYTDLIAKLKASIANVSSALGTLGASNNAMTNHLTFVSKLQDSLTTGIGNLVDADVAKESANLTALQTKQQLGVQALSIANQAPQTILSLFKG